MLHCSKTYGFEACYRSMDRAKAADFDPPFKVSGRPVRNEGPVSGPSRLPDVKPPCLNSPPGFVPGGFFFLGGKKI